MRLEPTLSMAFFDDRSVSLPKIETDAAKRNKGNEFVVKWFVSIYLCLGKMRPGPLVHHALTHSGESSIL